MPTYDSHTVKSIKQAGFSLLQLAIVLVIIGLLAGGIMVGRDLISAAAVKAQISQIDNYNAAVNLFNNKYGYLPGDIPNPYASNFGFSARGAFAGEGDGNGVLQGNCGNSSSANVNSTHTGCGELAVFWQDLSTASLLNGYVISTGSCLPSENGTGMDCEVDITTKPGVKDWIPPAKLGGNNYVYVFSNNNINYFGVSQIYQIGWTYASTLSSPNSGSQSMTVQQAYNIDQKVDDGLPQSGIVIACYIDFSVAQYQQIWAAGGGNQGAGGANCASSASATIYHSYNCYDNNGVAGTQTYSLLKNANSPNCALSFQFQN